MFSNLTKAVVRTNKDDIIHMRQCDFERHWTTFVDNFYKCRQIAQSQRRPVRTNNYLAGKLNSNYFK